MPRRKTPAEAPAAPWYEDPDNVSAAARPFVAAWFGRCVHVPHDPDNPQLAGDCPACLNALLANALGAYNGLAKSLEDATAAWAQGDPRRGR